MDFNHVLEIMAEKGITQKQLADALKVSTGKVSDWKKGKIMSWTKRIPEISAYLGVSADELMGTKKPLVNNDEELTEYLEMLRNRPECRVLLSITKDATKDEVEENVRFITALRQSKNND